MLYYSPLSFSSHFIVKKLYFKFRKKNFKTHENSAIQHPLNYYIFSQLLAFHSPKKKFSETLSSSNSPVVTKTIPFTFTNFSRNLNLPITPSIVTTHHESLVAAIKSRSKHPGPDRGRDNLLVSERENSKFFDSTEESSDPKKINTRTRKKKRERVSSSPAHFL